jgi:hypothetical protein
MINFYAQYLTCRNTATVDDAVGEITDTTFPLHFSLSVQIGMFGQETKFYR